MRVGVNCLDVDPSFVGGVTTYVLGFWKASRVVATAADSAYLSPRGIVNSSRSFGTAINSKSWSFVTGYSRCGAALPGASLSCSSKLFKFTSDVAFAKIRELMDAESDVLYTPTPCSGASTAAGPRSSVCTISSTSITRNSSVGRGASAGTSPTD